MQSETGLPLVCWQLITDYCDMLSAINLKKTCKSINKKN